MAKAGVLSVSPNSLQRAIPLKRLYLLFNKLYLDRSTFTNSIAMLASENKITPDTFPKIETIPKGSVEYFNKNSDSNKIFNNLKGLGFLNQEGFVDIQEVVVSDKTTYLLDDFIFSGGGTLDEINDRCARMLSLVKQIDEEEDSFPLLICPPKREGPGKKTSVINFLLSKVPEPSENVSWEQLKEFKSDPDTLRKYYALTKWINEVAKKDCKFSEIEEEYQSIYSEYVNQYKIHKLKYKLGIIETIVTASIDVLSGLLSVGQIYTSLFSMWKHDLNLLEAETKFTGREVAYIYKVKQEFE